MKIKSQFFLASAAIGLSLLSSIPAHAQDTNKSEKGNEDDADETTESADDKKGIIVTGSRIARPTLKSTVPITSVDVAELTTTGDLSIGDALNDLPSLRSTFGSGNSQRFIGTTGLNSLDLRGLGTSRTLVLVNGKRHVTAVPGDYLVDTNTIPSDLLQRVDIVTGGNSAVYGSDAVAGVVNFILKRDYDGITARAGGGISSRGDRGSRFGSLTAGTNFADGRGNIAVALEYAQTDRLNFVDRDYLTGAFSGRCQFNATDSDPANTPNPGESSDGIFDAEFFCGVRNGTISDGGTVGGTNLDNYLRFQPDGTLLLNTPIRSFRPLSANQIGGNGSTLRNTSSLLVGSERFSANLLAHFDISESFRPFIEAKYVRTNTSGEGQPSFLNAGPQSVGAPALRCDNPFLSAQALQVLQKTRLNGATRVICDAPARTFNLSRFNVDFGGRGERQKRETYRVVGGVEGTFNDDWRYEVTANYGRFENFGRSVNNLVLADVNGNPDGFSLAVDAVRNGSSQIVCRVNQVTVTRPDCVPINLFGSGAPSAAALDFVNTEGERNAKATELQVVGFVSGDLSQAFEFPGGPIGFALGTEYRKETASERYDDLTASGGTFLNALQPFNPPKLTSKEAFGEVRFPILADTPFFQELTLEAAGRVSDYNTQTGTVYSYNFGGVYAPSTDVRFRVNYSTAVRAPTQSDLYSPFSENFAQIIDPCETINLGLNPNLAANCLAGGVPTVANAALVAACAGTPFPQLLGGAFVNCVARTSSTGFASGGNIDLKAEKSKSLTIGAAITPSFLPGFSFTVDYYRIRVNSLIAGLGAQTLINACYTNAGGINNQFCATVSRNPATGLFLEPAVLSSGINFAAQKTQGIDFDLAYRKTFENGQRFSIRGIATYVIELNNFTDPAEPRNFGVQRGGLGDPKLAANLYTTYDFGDLAVQWNVRFLGKQRNAGFSSINNYQQVCTAQLAASLPAICGGQVGNLVTFPAANTDSLSIDYFPRSFYHDMRATFDIGTKFQFYAGMDNVFDKKPPLGLLGTAGGDPFDSVGRYFYAGVKANF